MTQARLSRTSADAPEPDSSSAPSPFGLPIGWWPVAHGHEILQHPVAFQLGNQKLALYRDLSGAARAVEDRCPHRRLPLSMGRLTEDGSIQCPYHGWSFDGATGRCTAIPNLSEGERIPAGIKVTAFSAVETLAESMGYGLRTSKLAPRVEPTGEEPDAGTTMYDAALVSDMVFIWTGPDAPAARPVEPADMSARIVADGTVQVRSPHPQLAEAFLVNPAAALGLGPMFGSGDEQCSPAVQVHRSGADVAIEVTRHRLAYGLPRVSTFESLSKRVVSSRITTSVATGLTRVEGAGGQWLPGCRLTIALTPVGDYRTQVRWQIRLDGDNHKAAMAAARTWAAARTRSGLTTTAIERLADTMETTVDQGVVALREARAATNATR